MITASTNSIRLVGTDLDGTLLDSFGQVSQENIRAINQAKLNGITVIAATARSITSTKKISARAGLGPYAVCQNGAAIYDLDNNRILSHTPISKTNAETIVSLLKEKLPGILFSVEKLGTFIPEELFFPAPLPGLTTEPVKNILSHITEPITKIICRHPQISHRELWEVAFTYCGHLADTTSAGGDWVDFQAHGVTKATGLRQVAEKLGISQFETAAIGDQRNDEPMLRWARYSAAPFNASEGAKALASWIAPPHTEDAVAAFLDHVSAKFNGEVNRPQS